MRARLALEPGRPLSWPLSDRRVRTALVATVALMLAGLGLHALYTLDRVGRAADLASAGMLAALVRASGATEGPLLDAVSTELEQISETVRVMKVSGEALAQTARAPSVRPWIWLDDGTWLRWGRGPEGPRIEYLLPRGASASDPATRDRPRLVAEHRALLQLTHPGFRLGLAPPVTYGALIAVLGWLAAVVFLSRERIVREGRLVGVCLGITALCAGISWPVWVGASGVLDRAGGLHAQRMAEMKAAIDAAHVSVGPDSTPASPASEDLAGPAPRASGEATLIDRTRPTASLRRSVAALVLRFFACASSLMLCGFALLAAGVTGRTRSGTPHWRRSDTHVTVWVAVCGLAGLAIDVMLPVAIAAGTSQVAPVLVSLASPHAGLTLTAAAAGTAFIGAGLLSGSAGPLPVAVGNATLCIGVVWLTALFCLWQKRRAVESAELWALARERGRAAAAIHKSERKFRALFDTRRSATITADTAGTIIEVNHSLESLTGWSQDEIVGRPLAVLIPEPYRERHRAAFESCREGGFPESRKSLHLEGLRKDGTVFPCELTLVTMGSVAGEEPLVLAAMQDLTERRQLELQLLHAQKMESIGQLAAGIAHEINTPTQFVGDNVRFLADSIDDMRKVLAADRPVIDAVLAGQEARTLAEKALEQRQTVDLEMIEEEAGPAVEQTLDGVRRIGSIVAAMKKFSHPGSDSYQEADLNEALRTTVQVSRNEWKYVSRIELDLDAGLPCVRCLIGELNQVFLNLIVNAAHAMEAKERPDGALGTIRILTRRADPMVEIRVADDGCGMPEHVRPRIFEPFFTTKGVGRGTGQGLAIAHAVIVKKHRGTIECESQEGRGSTFIVRLPIEGCPDLEMSRMDEQDE